MDSLFEVFLATFIFIQVFLAIFIVILFSIFVVFAFKSRLSSGKGRRLVNENVLYRDTPIRPRKRKLSSLVTSKDVTVVRDIENSKPKPKRDLPMQRSIEYVPYKYGTNSKSKVSS